MGRSPQPSLLSLLLKTVAFTSPPKPPHFFAYLRRLVLLSPISSNTFPSSQYFSSVANSQVEITPKPYYGIGKSVISQCSHLWDKKAETFAENSSLHDILKEYGDLSPETTRRFWRVSALTPKDFLEILVGFGPEVNSERKLEFLWNLFNWAPKKSRGFCHLPGSYEIMASMLVRCRRLADAESLLLSEEAKGVFCGDKGWIFSEIVKGYAEDCLLENSVMLYDQARKRGVILSASCYKALLGLLIRKRKDELAVRVYGDMVEVGLGSASEDCFLEFAVGLLSKRGQILEAVNLVRRLRSVGAEPSLVVLTAIVEGYCRKKDYEDVLSFVREWKHIPDVCVCNKIVSSLCRDLGSEEAWLFVQKMEVLGFQSDAITFGILISQSCRERKVRIGFIYLSECYSRSIIPKVHAYNVLISSVFMEGLHRSARHIFDEMVEKGITPDLSTFKVMLAGYCKYRKFDEVKEIVGDMANCGMISLAPMEDLLSKAFKVLCLDRLGVKVRRDNDVGLVKAEFFDSLGNGLYLETDIEEYDKILAGILENSTVPDFDSIILKECRQGKIEAALRVKDEAVQWGQDLSLFANSELLKGFCASPSHITKATSLLEEMPELQDQLHLETLNLLIRNLSKNEMTDDAALIMDRLLKREPLIEKETYPAVVMGFCKENVNGLRHCWEFLLKSTSLPGSKDIVFLVSTLCKSGMIKEVLELFDSVIEKYPQSISSVCNVVVKELCLSGFTNIGASLTEVMCQRGLVVDHSAYMDLVVGFLKQECSTGAVGIVDILLEKNIIPSVKVYQLLVPSLLRLNRTDKVMTLKQALLSTQFKHAGSVHCTLVTELCRAKRMKEAVLQLQEMLSNQYFPDNTTLNALLVGYCHSNNLGKALEVLCIMLRKHVDISLSGYRSLVRQMCSHGRSLGALRIKELMLVERKSESLTLHNILIFRLLQREDNLLIESLLNSMQEKQLVPDRNTYDFLICGYYRCGHAHKSVQSLNTMIAAGMRPSNRSLRTVICYLCSQGELSKALELSKVMESGGWKHGSVIQYALSVALILHGDLPKAEFFLDKMEEKGLIPSNIDYDLLIQQFCLQGSLTKAVHLLNVMLKKGSLPSGISYNSVIHGLCNQNAFDQALDLHVEMLNKNLELSMQSCDALVHGLCANGRTEDARKVLGAMLHFGPIPTCSMYNCVINRYHAEKNLDKALELLREMQQVGHLPNFETQWSLISNLSCCDDKEDGTGKGILSHLLSGSEIPTKKFCRHKI